MSTSELLTAGACATKAAALLEEAERAQSERSMRLVGIADGWRRLGETIAENPSMLPTSPREG